MDKCDTESSSAWVGTNWKKAQNYLETCLVRVSLASVLSESLQTTFLAIWKSFETHFGASLTLEGPWESPWDLPGTLEGVQGVLRDDQRPRHTLKFDPNFDPYVSEIDHKLITRWLPQFDRISASVGRLWSASVNFDRISWRNFLM